MDEEEGEALSFLLSSVRSWYNQVHTSCGLPVFSMLVSKHF